MRGSHCPLLMVSSEHWDLAKYQAPFRKDLATNTSPAKKQSDEGSGSSSIGSIGKNCFTVTIRGTGHLNFCDMHLMASPLVMKLGNKLGPADPLLFNEAMNHLLLRFFTATGASNDMINIADDSLSDTERLLKFLGMRGAVSGAVPSDEVLADQESGIDNALLKAIGGQQSYSYQQQSQVDGSVLVADGTVDVKIEESSAVESNKSGVKVVSFFKDIQALPESVEKFIVSSMADESSLAHCYDDTYFKMLQTRELA
jgi:hypothetical protein